MIMFDAILKSRVLILVMLALVFLATGSPHRSLAEELVPTKREGVLRIATYNVSLNRPSPGALTEDLKKHDAQAWAIATVIRAVQPDVLLVNELDYSTDADNAQLLEANYFAKAEPDLLGGTAWPMPYHFSAESNTGVDSGLDVDSNGKKGEPNDAFGYGRFPGQYGMAVFSRFEIVKDDVVTLQKFPWSDLPEARRPKNPKTNKQYYEDDVWGKLRLSSKSLWSVPIKTPQGRLHAIASHPTPPAFDGADDHNGCRNHDEIRLIQLLIESSKSLKDDRGKAIQFPKEDAFVVLGDLNCDPKDGDSQNEAINALLKHPDIAQMPAPRSDGAVEASKKQGKMNAKHRSDPAEDTADFNDTSVGNLRADYVIPSRHCKVIASGVFWPSAEQVNSAQADTIQKLLEATDHHLVWVDVQLR